MPLHTQARSIWIFQCRYTELDRTLNKNKQHIKKLGEEYSLIEDKNEKAMKKAEIDKVAVPS